MVCIKTPSTEGRSCASVLKKRLFNTQCITSLNYLGEHQKYDSVLS